MPTFAPQPGAQTAFLASPADLVVYGGAAGGGKSYALLLDELRHVHRPGYRSVIFRRTSPQITAGGGLWDTAGAIFPRFGGVANQSALKYTFPSGAEVKFTHLEHEKTKYNHDGSQYAKESFDELIHFTRTQFFYLLSRLRSVCGVRPYVRATTNPDAASWVRQFVGWWIDPALGVPVPERAGVVRWLYVVNDEAEWYDTRGLAEAAHPDLAAVAPPKSVTFIPATLDDNPALTAADPNYRANLLALSFVERGRLLGGNWNVTAAVGLFRADWFGEPADPPTAWRKRVRAWDLAATEQKPNADPDYLASVLLGDPADQPAPAAPEVRLAWVLDATADRLSPLRVEQRIEATAEADGTDVEIVFEQEPGASGKILATQFRARLQAKGYTVTIFKPSATTGDKVTRAYPVSAACERGRVRLAKGGWVKPFLAELCGFPTGPHDDRVDAFTTAHGRLARPHVGFAAV